MQVLADLVLVVHFAVALFIVGGLLCIWLGAALDWFWTRNHLFRSLHLVAIVFVAAQALLGLMCPLTIWEDALRGEASQSGFIARWVSRLLFYDLPPWVFTTSYVGAALLTALGWRCVPPRRRKSEIPRC